MTQISLEEVHRSFLDKCNLVRNILNLLKVLVPVIILDDEGR